MKITVKIRNDNSEIREKDTDASTLLKLVNSSETLLTATEYHKGWYYISDYFGWVKVKDVTVTSIIEPINDGDMSDVTDPEEVTHETQYDAEQIVNAINGGSYKIRANKIYLIINDEEINLETILKSLNNSLNDIQDVLEKVNIMPEIPAITTDNTEGMALVLKVDNTDPITPKIVCVWENIKYGNITDTPTGSVIAVEW